MKFTGSSVRFAWILGVLIVPVASAQEQGLAHVFNGAAAHDGAAAARLAAEAHLGSDAKAIDHFHSPEASSHLTTTHPSTSEFNGFEGHGTTVARDTPKVEPRPDPHVTAPAAKVHPSSSEFKGFEGHGGNAKSSSSGSSRSNESIAKTERPVNSDGRNQPLNNSQSRDLAKYSGMKPVKDPPFDSHGQLVFAKDGKFFTADVDGHNGGVWKEFSRRGQRVGTVNESLTKIGK